MAASQGQIRFEAQQAEFSYFAALDPPVFDVLGPGGRLYAAIFAGFTQFRARLTDIRVESRTVNPAEISVVCSLLDLGSLIRYRLDRVEVWCTNPRRVGEAKLEELIHASLHVLHEASQTARVATHTLSLGVHGLLVGETVDLRLANYVSNAPEGTLEFRASGVSFSHQWPEGGGESSLVLERSVALPDGAFIRVTSVHPGRLPEREAFQRGAKFAQAAIAQLGIEFHWGT